jgi:hypothetical protein
LASSASSTLQRGREIAETIETPRSPSTWRVFQEYRKNSATSAPSAFESVSASSASSTLQWGREIAETIETPTTRRVFRRRPEKLCDLGALGV